jgi:hypothetical protein
MTKNPIPATASQILAVGETIVIDHEQGKEVGTIRSFTDLEIARNPIFPITVTVQFADGTISSWPWINVDSIATLRLRNN